MGLPRRTSVHEAWSRSSPPKTRSPLGSRMDARGDAQLEISIEGVELAERRARRFPEGRGRVRRCRNVFRVANNRLSKRARHPMIRFPVCWMSAKVRWADATYGISATQGRDAPGVSSTTWGQGRVAIITRGRLVLKYASATHSSHRHDAGHHRGATQGGYDAMY